MWRLVNNSRGFSLIEVVVSFMILALALGALMSGLGAGVRGTDRAAQASLALLYAESLLAETGATVPLVAGETSGERDGGYRWKRDIRPFPVKAAEGVTPFQISISVTPPGRGNAITLTTLRLAASGAVP